MDRKKMINNVLLTYFKEHHVKMGMKFHIDYYLVKDICALLKLIPNAALFKIEKRYKDAGLSLDGIIETIPNYTLPEGRDMDFYVNAQGAFEMFFMSETAEAVKFRAWVISELLINSDIEFEGDMESSMLAPVTRVAGAGVKASMESFKTVNAHKGQDAFFHSGAKPLLALHDVRNSRKGIVEWLGKHEDVLEADIEAKATYECASQIHDDPFDKKYEHIHKKYGGGRVTRIVNGEDLSYDNPLSDY